MKRRVSAVLLCVLAAAGLLWPLLPAVVPPDAQSAGPDPVSVTSYDATYDVAADGRLVATESLTTAFPFGRHGIFRYWDVSDRNDASVRYQPDISSITLDGAPVQYETTWDGGRRYFVAKIGDPDRFVTPGTHVYRITYAIDGTISPVDAGKVAYASTAARTTVPRRPSCGTSSLRAGSWTWERSTSRCTCRRRPAACSAGAAGHRCTVPDHGAGTSTVTLSATDVPALSGMSTRITSDAPAPARTHLPWPVTFDQILGTSVPAVVVVAVLCVLLFALGVAWARRSREPVPGLPVMYAPPAGLGPVQTVYVDTEGAGGHALVASLLHLAERDVVALEQRSDDTWLVTGKGTPEQWAQLDPVSRSVGESLGVTSPGLWFLADKGKGAGQQLSHATTALQKAVGGWAVTAGVSRSDSGERCAKAFWYLTLVLAAIGFTTLLGPSMYGLPLAAFAIGGVGLSAAGVGVRRTPRGAGSGRRPVGSNGCCRHPRPRTASTSPRARTCSSRSSPTPSRSASPTGGRRGTGQRPARNRRHRCGTPWAAVARRAGTARAAGSTASTRRSRPRSVPTRRRSRPPRAGAAEGAAVAEGAVAPGETRPPQRPTGHTVPDRYEVAAPPARPTAPSGPVR